MIGPGFTFVRPNRDYRELLLLSHIEAHPRASQRELGRQAGITAAMVNHYILEFVAREYIEVDGVTNRSMSYRLTPLGLQRRRELQDRMLAEMWALYGEIKSTYRRSLSKWVEQGKRKAVVVGATEKALVVRQAAVDEGMEVDAVVEGRAEPSPEADVILDCRADRSPLDCNGTPVERF